MTYKQKICIVTFFIWLFIQNMFHAQKLFQNRLLFAFFSDIFKGIHQRNDAVIYFHITIHCLMVYGFHFLLYSQMTIHASVFFYSFHYILFYYEYILFKFYFPYNIYVLIRQCYFYVSYLNDSKWCARNSLNYFLYALRKRLQSLYVGEIENHKMNRLINKGNEVISNSSHAETFFLKT